jgi:hypothetical protein
LVFSYGKYAFLGENVALVELNKVIVEVSVLECLALVAINLLLVVGA